MGIVFRRVGRVASPIVAPDNFKVWQYWRPGFTVSLPYVMPALLSARQASSLISFEPHTSSVSKLKQKPSVSKKVLLKIY